MTRNPPPSAVPGHDTRTRIRGGLRWEALCSCGWVSRAVRWKVSAWDAAAGHLLDASEAEVQA